MDKILETAGWQEIIAGIMFILALIYLVRFIYISMKSEDCSSCPSCDVKDIVSRQTHQPSMKEKQ